jgi:hypothetical protein
MNESVVPWDLYREIHKAMRYALFGVTTLAGQTDPADTAALRRLSDEWRQVAFVLCGHHEHEDRWCDPLIQRHAPALREALEDAHRRSAAAIEHLQRSAARLAESDAVLRGALLRSFYLDLSDFTADYLRHLRDEEERVMPALNAAMSNEELAQVTASIRGSVAPRDMCVYIRYMAPAMNHAERVDMLGGMHAAAPPEIFEMFRNAAQAALAPGEYDAVASKVGFALS